MKRRLEVLGTSYESAIWNDSIVTGDAALKSSNPNASPSSIKLVRGNPEMLNLLGKYGRREHMAFRLGSTRQDAEKNYNRFEGIESDIHDVPSDFNTLNEVLSNPELIFLCRDARLLKEYTTTHVSRMGRDRFLPSVSAAIDVIIDQKAKPKIASGYLLSLESVSNIAVDFDDNEMCMVGVRKEIADRYHS
ncbi:MAG: hypothetical protein ACMXYF_01610 [Candidatus Woesearchaeota archaeon]